MKSLLKILLAVSLLTALLVPVAVTADSSVLFNGACSSNGAVGANNNANSVVCQDDSSSTTNPLLGSNGLLFKISAIIALIAGIAATIVIIVSGLRYITSGGDPTKAQGARSTLINAIIGVVVIVLSEGIISFVLSKV